MFDYASIRARNSTQNSARNSDSEYHRQIAVFSLKKGIFRGVCAKNAFISKKKKGALNILPGVYLKLKSHQNRRGDLIVTVRKW